MHRYREYDPNYSSHGGGFAGFGGQILDRFTGTTSFCPPSREDEKSWTAPPGAIDPDGNPADHGYPGYGRFVPPPDGCCFGHGHSSPWGSGFGYHGRGFYPHNRMQSEEFHAELFGLLKTGLGLLEDALRDSPFLGLLGDDLHEALSRLVGPIPGRAGRRAYDEDNAVAHLAQFLTKGGDKFVTVSHWSIPGFDRGGFGEPHIFPKPCVEPPEFGFKVFRPNPASGELVDLNDGEGDLGRGNGFPSHRYPWAQEEHQKTLYVGVLNGNPNHSQSVAGGPQPVCPTARSHQPCTQRGRKYGAGRVCLRLPRPLREATSSP